MEKFVIVHSRAIYTSDEVLQIIKEMDQQGYDLISIVPFPTMIFNGCNNCCDSGDLYFKLRDHSLKFDTLNNQSNSVVENKSIEWIKPSLDNPAFKKAAKNLRIQVNTIKESFDEGLLVILEDHLLNDISNYIPVDITDTVDQDFLEKNTFKLSCPVVVNRKNKKLYLIDGLYNLNYCYTFCIKPVVFWINLKTEYED